MLHSIDATCLTGIERVQNLYMRCYVYMQAAELGIMHLLCVRALTTLLKLVLAFHTETNGNSCCICSSHLVHDIITAVKVNIIPVSSLWNNLSSLVVSPRGPMPRCSSFSGSAVSNE